MSKSRWTWAAAASATLAGVAAAMLMTGTAPARSDDDEDEVHTPSRDFELATAVLDNWSSESDRETALAAYLGAASREDLLAPVEDPSYLDSH